VRKFAKKGKKRELEHRIQDTEYRIQNTGYRIQNPDTQYASRTTQYEPSLRWPYKGKFGVKMEILLEF